MKYFVVSDIHGHFDLLMETLKDKYDENNPHHRLIVAGDLFDRGNQNVEVFEYVFRLHQENKAIIIKGNHDGFFEDVFNDEIENVFFNIKHNGFGNSIRSFAPGCDRLYEVKEYIEKHNPQLMPFLQSLPYYFETSQYIVTHAGLDFSKGDWHMGDWRKAVWMDTRTFFSVDLKKKHHLEKKVIVGHFYVNYLREHFHVEECPDSTVYIHRDQQKIGIDAGVYHTKKLNVFEFEDE